MPTKERSKKSEDPYSPEKLPETVGKFIEEALEKPTLQAMLGRHKDHEEKASVSLATIYTTEEGEKAELVVEYHRLPLGNLVEHQLMARKYKPGQSRAKEHPGEQYAFWMAKGFREGEKKFIEGAIQFTDATRAVKRALMNSEEAMNKAKELLSPLL